MGGGKARQYGGRRQPKNTKLSAEFPLACALRLPETSDQTGRDVTGDAKCQHLFDETNSRFHLRASHKPTRATFSPYPGEPGWGRLDPGQLGNVLPNGDDYEPNEVDAMMQQLWIEYVAANPDLFKTPD